MAASMRARAPGAHYSTEGSAALKARPEARAREDIIREAQQIRRKRLEEQRDQGLSLRAREGDAARARRRHAAAQWRTPAALCAVALIMLALVMVRHLEVTRGSIAINGMNTQLKQIEADTDRLSLELAKAAEVESVKNKASQMGFYYPGEDRIIRVTLPEVPQQDTQQGAHNEDGGGILDALLDLITNR